VFSYNCIASKHCSGEVERTFSSLNNNKNKLRNRLTVCILEAIVSLSPVRIFQVTLKSTKDLCIYMAKQGKHLKILKLSLMRLFL